MQGESCFQVIRTSSGRGLRPAPPQTDGGGDGRLDRGRPARPSPRRASSARSASRAGVASCASMIDQRAPQFRRRHGGTRCSRELLEVVVQQPGMVDARPAGSAPRARECGAMAAMDRARGELRARDHVGLPPRAAPARRPVASASPRRPPVLAARQPGRGRAAAPRAAPEWPAAVGLEQAAAAARRNPAGNSLRTVSSPIAPSPRRGAPRARRGAPACRRPPASVSRIHSISASGRAAPITSATASRPPERTRSSGSWPPAGSANLRLLPGLSSGSARSTAR